MALDLCNSFITMVSIPMCPARLGMPKPAVHLHQKMMPKAPSDGLGAPQRPCARWAHVVPLVRAWAQAGHSPQGCDTGDTPRPSWETQLLPWGLPRSDALVGHLSPELCLMAPCPCGATPALVGSSGEAGSLGSPGSGTATGAQPQPRQRSPAR